MGTANRLLESFAKTMLAGLDKPYRSDHMVTVFTKQDLWEIELGSPSPGDTSQA